MGEEISRASLGDQMPANSFFYLKFDCQNPATVAETLLETVDSLKEFLGEIDENLAPIIEKLEFNVLTLDNGVAVTLNLDSHPILAPYVMMAKGSSEPVKVFDPKVEVQFGSSKSLNDDNLLGGEGFFNVNVNSKSIVDALLNNNMSGTNKEIESKIKSAIKKKLGIEVSMFLSLLNAKSLDLTLQMYKVEEGKIEMKVNLKDQLKKLIESQKENPALAVVRSMEFIKEAIDTLKQNNLSELHIGVGLGELHGRLDLALDMTEILELVFTDDDDDDDED